MRARNNYDWVSLRAAPVSVEARTIADTTIFNRLTLTTRNKPLTINNDGKQRRDFVHVDDIVDANILIANSKNKFKGDIYNVGSGINHSINEIADMFGGEKEYGNEIRDF